MNPSVPLHPNPEPGSDEPRYSLSRTLYRAGAAFVRKAELLRVAALVALLIFGGLWFAVSALDRFWGTDFLARSGLFIISGPPITTGVAFVFYSASLAALALSIAVPALRRGFFRIEQSPPGPNHGPIGLPARFRQFFALKPIDWVAVVGSNIGILGLRFVLYPFPQGADTPQYLGAANSIMFRFNWDSFSQLHAVGIGRWLTVFGITGLRVILSPFPGQPELGTMIAVPIVLGVLYSLSIWSFIYRLMGDRRLAIGGAIIAPISFLTIDLSYGLFAQFLGKSLSIFALTGFLAVILRGRDDTRGTAVMYLAALLAHIWTWAVFVAISLSILGWALLSDPKGRGEKIRRAMWVLGPSIATMAVVMILLLNVQIAVLYPYSVGEAHPFTLPEGWLWIGGWESAVVWALGLIGLLLLTVRQSVTLVRVPLLLWTGTISAAVFVAGIRDSYRLLVMYPMPILVVFGLRHLVARVRIPVTGAHPGALSARTVHGLPTAALVLVLLGSVLPWAYIPGWQYFPGGAAYQQLVEIRARYGYGNGSVLVLIDQRYHDDALTWSEAVTGAQVYPGNLLALLRGDPYARDELRWFSPDLNGVTEILLPSTLYSPDSMEAPLLASGEVPGVPSRAISGAFNVSSFLATAALSLSSSFWTNWTLDTTTLDHTFSTANSQLTWTLPPQPSGPETRGVSYVRPLPNRTAESLYLLLSGLLNGAEGSLEVDYWSGNATVYAIDRILTNPLLIRVPLSSAEAPMQVKVAFWVPEGKTSLGGWMEISYMGLVSH